MDQIRLKVWAASNGAGLGSGLGSYMAISEADDIAIFIAEAFTLTLSESGMRGLTTFVGISIAVVTAYVGAFAAGYLKTERHGAFR